MSSRARNVIAAVVMAALFLPGLVALAGTLHALHHGGAPVANRDLALLASHGHAHAAMTPPHDHGVTYRADGPALSPPSLVGVLSEIVAATSQQSTFRATEPRSRGSGGELVLTLCCVLLL